jgi:hypothetical protein
MRDSNVLPTSSLRIRRSQEAFMDRATPASSSNSASPTVRACGYFLDNKGLMTSFIFSLPMVQKLANSPEPHGNNSGFRGHRLFS